MSHSRQTSVQSSKQQSKNDDSRRISQVVASSQAQAFPDGLAEDLRNLGIADDQVTFYQRSAPVIAPDKIEILVNWFKVSYVGQEKYIYTYNVTAALATGSQRQANARERRRILEILLGMPAYAHVSSDYEQRLVSTAELTEPGTDLVETVEYYDRGETTSADNNRQLRFQIRISCHANPLPTAPLKAFGLSPHTPISRIAEYEDCLNIMLLRDAAQNPVLTTAAQGTKVFPLRTGNARHKLGFGLEAYRGYSRSIKSITNGMGLCLFTTTSCMYQDGSPDDLISELQKNPDIGSSAIKLNQNLKGIRVRADFDVHRTKPIDEVVIDNKGFVTAGAWKFAITEDPLTGQPTQRTVTVAEYFQTRYPADVRPGLEKSHLLNVGSRDKPVMWPTMLCTVQAGQPFKGLIENPVQSAQMIRHACRDPATNRGFICNEGLLMLGIRRNQDGMGYFAGSQLQLSLDMMTVAARRTPAPALQFSNGTISPIAAANGQFNLRGRKFHKPARPSKYAILFVHKHPNQSLSNLPKFTTEMETAIKNNLGWPANLRLPATGVRQTLLWDHENAYRNLTTLFREFANKQIHYCFVISSNYTWYGLIKHASDGSGMHTSVTLLNDKGYVKDRAPEVANLLLKFNMKLGGYNWKLDMSNYGREMLGQTMICGADVVHPPPSAMSGAPSVAALVASTCADGVFYPGIIDLQTNPDRSKQAMEIILNLKTMLVTRLRLWQTKNGGRLPERLLMFRDGVGDSQLLQVLVEELPQMQQACKEIYGPHAPLPKITIIVVQKRHNTRLFKHASAPQDNFDRAGNAKPGMTIDNGIVSNTWDDWYNVSHVALKGTARPAHFIRIHDEVGYSFETIQYVSNALAYDFGRSTTPLSVPAPARYADRLCDRAKIHMRSVYFPAPPAEVPRGHPKPPRPVYVPSRHFQGQSSIHASIRDTMYYI